jgi:thioredoxin reductase (NADPH)
VDIHGETEPLGVTHVTLRNLKTGAESNVDTHGVFVAIGHKPSTELFVGQIDMRPNGYINVKPGTTQTNIPGVFAAGDVADEVFRQAVTAAGLGCMAALEAEKFLAEHAHAPAAAKAAAAG